ncbi:MAG: CAP domain-containing protein [Desulfobacterales bacterium]|nr:CAP domain-containing protein [Desulfobacterales bacterium]
MKTFIKILIAVVIIILIFFKRDDLISFYSKIFSYFESKYSTQINFKIPDKFDLQNILKEIKSVDEVKQLKEVVTTPGVLRIQNKVIDLNTDESDLTVEGIIFETNKVRKETNNLPFLKENKKLDLSAQRKLDDMFSKQYFEHISPNGTGIEDLVKQENYEYIIVGENLALGNFKNNEALVDAWMASPGHRENILNNSYAEIGVAVGYNFFEGKKVWLAVQHFGLSRDVCPTVNGILKGIIEINQKKAKELELDLVNRQNDIRSGSVIEGKTTNEQITIYNEIVNSYNKLIFDLKNKISEYNKEVEAFNNCVRSLNGT